MHTFICCIDEIFEYLKHCPTFGKDQGLTEEKNIELVNFALPFKWQKKIPTQEFDSYTKSLNNLVNFCEKLERVKEIFNYKGDASHPN